MAKRYVTGDKHVRSVFKQLGRSLNNAISDAQRFALQPTLRAARNNASDDPELAKALVIRKDSQAPKNLPTYQIGPRKDAAARRRAHLREFDVAPHSLAKGAERRTGKLQDKGPHHPGTTARPFLTPAFEETADEVIDRFANRIGTSIEKQAAKLAKKGAK